MSWFCAHHGVGTDPKYPMIRSRTGVDCARIGGLWMALMDHASTARPRGSVAKFSAAQYEEFSGMPLAEIEAVLAVMEVHPINMIKDGVLVAWEERQPKKVDRTVGKRVKEHRERKKQAKKPPSETDVTGVTHRNNVDTFEGVTPVTPLDREKERSSFELSPASQASNSHTPNTSASRAMTPEQVWAGLDQLGLGVAYLARGFHAGKVRGWLAGGLTSEQLLEAHRRAAAARDRANDSQPVNIGFLNSFVTEVLSGATARTTGSGNASVDSAAQQFASRN